MRTNANLIRMKQGNFIQSSTYNKEDKTSKSKRKKMQSRLMEAAEKAKQNANSNGQTETNKDKNGFEKWKMCDSKRKEGKQMQLVEKSKNCEI